MIRITRDQAAEAMARLALADGCPHRAAHHVRTELDALRPYTCRPLSALLPVFETIQRMPARAEALALLAQGITPERYTDKAGALHFRPAGRMEAARP